MTTEKQMTIKILTHEFKGPFPFKLLVPLKKKSPLKIINSAIKNIPGVYVILTEGKKEGGWEVIDVGMSRGIKKRLMNHEREDCWEENKVKTIRVAVLLILNPEIRSSIEQKIREKYKPECGDF